ncbi:MAG: DUF1698 domain-containing protein, partial [Candidatus Thioglobus sp.]
MTTKTMINNFTKQCAQSKISAICPQLIEASKQAFAVNNGNIGKWEAAIAAIKKQPKGALNYKKPYLHIDIKADFEALQNALKLLMPWRKGPYQIGDLQLDSEWRGDMKWQRL